MSKTITIDGMMAKRIFHGDTSKFETLDEGEWDVDYKYPNLKMVVRELASGKNYQMCIHRTGSPFFGYHYSFEYGSVELVEVELVQEQVILEVWKPVQ